MSQLSRIDRAGTIPGEPGWGLGAEDRVLRDKKLELLQALFATNTITRVPPRHEFSELAATWKEDTVLTSSVDDIVLHPAYQQIIGMGKRVVPWILLELQNEPNHWFWSLRVLTGINPVRFEDRGNIQAMTKAWLDWGTSMGAVD